jgi:hypothetical protein
MWSHKFNSEFVHLFYGDELNNETKHFSIEIRTHETSNVNFISNE